MAVQAISDGVYCIDVQHPDRQMFDALMPTEHGTTYNAFAVRGDTKTALIDTSDTDFIDLFLEYVRCCDISSLDYIITLHTEQDHSGALTALMKMYPKAQLVATEQAAKLMQSHLHIDKKKIKIVDEGDTLDLGGRTLKFMKIPFAHWPDNTMVYDSSSRILFSSDLFGSHYSSDRIFATSSQEIKTAARAYYSEIMMPFAPQVRKYTQKVIDLAPSIIASSHGPVWNQPSVILQKYMRWTSDSVEKTVVIPYVSMHGSCDAIMERLTLRLAHKGISVSTRNLGQTPESLAIQTGLVMRDLVTAAAVVFVVPTVLGGPHPAAAYCAMIVNALRPKTKYIGLLGSYGWGTKADSIFNDLTSGIKKATRLDPLLFEGYPTEEEFEQIDAYADDLADKIEAIEELL